MNADRRSVEAQIVAEVEALVAERVAAAVAAEREQWRGGVVSLADEFDANADRLYDEARRARGDVAVVLRSKSGTYAANAERLANLAAERAGGES